MDLNLNRRKSRIINDNFQLKIILSITGAVIIGFLVIIALVMIIQSQNSRIVIKSGRNIITVCARDTLFISSFMEDAFKKNPSPELFEEMKKEHDNNMMVIQENIEQMELISKRNFWIISIIIFLVFFFTIFLTCYLRRVTFHISGPIYVMQRQINDILEGRTPFFRELRDKDEFKDFYKSFRKLVEPKND
ncbi:MAG: hypothetical protein LBT84_04590 [Spirochaetia bacterium]|nr:hypothetical protein [Spirochaetia bacterium]